MTEAFLEGSQSNVRVIRLTPGQPRPPHTHGAPDLMLFAIEGEGVLTTGGGAGGFCGRIAGLYPGSEERTIGQALTLHVERVMHCG